ncbi:O-antigen polymerase [Adlercreutzia sp. ZJ473]|uniref:O-antigen polymerase n=1 Tax=Adlercreutzia sp. ZJ473 TaxID=2722822 RepID=UPI0015543B46|nr:O-antigen polymerase [Adlercreutzia sp. ZJ473]
MLILVTFLLGLLCFIARRITGTWLQPINIFCFVWMVSIVGSFAAEDLPWNMVGPLWLFGMLVCTLLGYLIGKQAFFKQGCCQNAAIGLGANKRLGLKIDEIMVLVSFISLGLAYFLIQASTYGISFSSFASVSSTLDMTSSISAERYLGTKSSGIASQILVCFVYAAAGIGGYLFNHTQKRSERALCLCTLIPITLLMLTTSGKAGFIGSAMLWICFYFARYFSIHKRLPEVTARRFILGAIVAIALLFLFYLTFLLRFGSFDSWAVQAALDKYSVYLFGEVWNFDYWASKYSVSNYEFGLNTFMAPFVQLGFVSRIGGVYTVLASGHGNVFSAFRGLILDYGFCGGLLFMLILGFVEGALCQLIYRGRETSPIVEVAYSAILYFYLYSFIISPWIYGTYIAAFLIIAVVCKFLARNQLQSF